MLHIDLEIKNIYLGINIKRQLISIKRTFESEFFTARNELPVFSFLNLDGL